ncbi:PPOX class F420-dependent oxidoreductase [Micromonospora sp. LOL_023]|uniref:PPOX class F420-dependent oxidoreductase n=1 Tax=Micromonospora sp. LOL_023 TaxID=3345418 RepID=UPI003A8C5C45
MEFERATTFMRANHRAVMVTHHADGRPQTSPVLVAVDDVGRVLVSTREGAVKVRNLLRDPRVTFCVTTDRFFGDWVQIDGKAEVVRLPEALDVLVDYYRRISGEHSDWDDYRAAMQRDRRVAIRVTITNAGPDLHG